jgi:IS5 family transposase
VLQFLLDLSDRQVAEAVRCRIDFKYALAMELDDPGFHHSVLADFRERLIPGDRADHLLDLALARLKEAGLVRERGTQRTRLPTAFQDFLDRQAIPRLKSWRAISI